MTDPETLPEQPSQPDPKTAEPNATVTFSIWPPTQRTRDAVINRLIETLSTSSLLSKRYGTLPSDEASVAARQIEHEAFSAVAASSATAADADGIEILSVYSKEISKRMLDTVMARAPPTPAAYNGSADDVSAAEDVAAAVSDS